MLINTGENIMDEKLVKFYQNPKLLGLSYSGSEALATCPRRWMLRKLSEIPKQDTIHTIFGKCFGEGVQGVLANKSAQDIIWTMFREWKYDLDEVNKQNKGFWYAMQGVHVFANTWEQVYSSEYELAYLDGKPAIELGIKIELPNNYYYVMYVDAVLVHKPTQQLVVFELKTSGAKYAEEATYQNSSQALGYGVVLDKIAQQMGLSSSAYSVMYMVFLTQSQQFVPMVFPKTAKQRAEFLQDLIMDLQVLEFYKQQQHFKKRGGGCKSYGSTCEFFDMCDMSLHALIPDHVLTTEVPPVRAIQYTYSFNDLINSQKEINNV